MSMENGSGGGRDGVFMALAIAIVLIFTIRIYSDYVTRPTAPPKQRPAEPPIYKPPKIGALFQPDSPYPAGLEDVQVGMKLSEIRDLGLPKGKLDHSVYSFRPADTPFKLVYCMLEVGERNPQTTSIIYYYRDSKARALVRQRALDAFGEAEVANTERGERLKWNHFDGTVVTLEADRYSVEEDLGHDQGDANPNPNSE